MFPEVYEIFSLYFLGSVRSYSWLLVTPMRSIASSLFFSFAKFSGSAALSDARTFSKFQKNCGRSVDAEIVENAVVR